MTLGPPVAGSEHRGSDVAAVLPMLEASTDYWRVRRAVKEAVVKPSMRLTTPEDFEKDVRRLMEASGLANRLRNFAFVARGKIPKDDVSDVERVHRAGTNTEASRVDTHSNHVHTTVGESFPNDAGGYDSDDAREAAGASSSVITCRRLWRREVIDRLLRLAETTGVPLAEHTHRTTTTEGSSMKNTKGKQRLRGWETSNSKFALEEYSLSASDALELADFTAQLPSQIEHVYDHGDLFKLVGGDASGNNFRNNKTMTSSLLSQMKPPSGREIRRFLKDLAPEMKQCGMDDRWDSKFSSERSTLAEQLVSSNDNTNVCRVYLRGGAPNEFRAQLWRNALGVGGSDMKLSFREEYTSAIKDARVTTMLTDLLCVSDVRLLCNHPSFFPFEETLRAALVAFVRDITVPNLCKQLKVRTGHPDVYVVVQGEDGEQGKTRKNTRYPPSGVVPFLGLAKLMAPLCFLYEHPADIAGVFKHLYVTVFKRLHAIDDCTFPKPALPNLLNMFDNEMSDKEPSLCFHLTRIKCPAAKLVTPWLLSGFASFLSTKETLLLWDRVIGFDSLVLLSVAACAIITLRKNALLAATNETEAFECVGDLSVVKIVPLVQKFLLQTKSIQEDGSESSEYESYGSESSLRSETQGSADFELSASSEDEVAEY